MVHRSIVPVACASTCLLSACNPAGESEAAQGGRAPSWEAGGRAALTTYTCVTSFERTLEGVQRFYDYKLPQAFNGLSRSVDLVITEKSGVSVRDTVRTLQRVEDRRLGPTNQVVWRFKPAPIDRGNKVEVVLNTSGREPRIFVNHYLSGDGKPTVVTSPEASKCTPTTRADVRAAPQAERTVQCNAFHEVQLGNGEVNCFVYKTGPLTAKPSNAVIDVVIHNGKSCADAQSDTIRNGTGRRPLFKSADAARSGKHYWATSVNETKTALGIEIVGMDSSIPKLRVTHKVPRGTHNGATSDVQIESDPRSSTCVALSGSAAR